MVTRYNFVLIFCKTSLSDIIFVKVSNGLITRWMVESLQQTMNTKVVN